MLIVIAGGSGFLGRKLQSFLRGHGHRALVLTRRPHGDEDVAWTPDGTAGAWASAIEGADAVVNLAGEGIADARWTATRKTALRTSRILSTRSIVAACHRAAQPPAMFLNASGAGYYGDRGSQIVTEETAAGTDFLAELCVAWEAEAEQAASRTRVVRARNGIVLHPSGGALAKMLLPFRLGAGGRLGPGTQYLPWIHLHDWLELTLWLMKRADASGPFNVTAPVPATNAEFTSALGAAVHRPTILPVPSIGLRLALGELADVLLTGQRAVPKRAEALGFTFRFKDAEGALRNLLS